MGYRFYVVISTANEGAGGRFQGRNLEVACCAFLKHQIKRVFATSSSRRLPQREEPGRCEKEQIRQEPSACRGKLPLKSCRQWTRLREQ
jgi:hypothetical protein